MKTLFIPSKARTKVNEAKIKQIAKKLPQNIAIAYSIQFKDIANSINKILSKTHKITSLVQVLGCSSLNFSEHTSAVLLIGSGKFHATALAFETKLPIYILNKDSLERVSEKDIDSLEKKSKSSYLRFLNTKRVGILVSLKPGQQRLNKALEIKKNIKLKDVYLFITNNINIQEFENFPIDSWINTACPRLDMDSKVINYKILEKNA